MSDAFEKAGASLASIRAYPAAVAFVAAGGTRDEWMAVFDQVVAKLPSVNPVIGAPKGQHTPVIARQPNTNGTGQGSIAQARPAVNVRPVREPSDMQRRAAGAVARIVALTVLDRVKTHDGRAWGKVLAGELDGMMQDGALAREVRTALGPLTGGQRKQSISELLQPAQFAAILARTGVSP